MDTRAEKQLPTASKRLTPADARVLQAKLEYLSRHPGEYPLPRIHCAHLPDLEKLVERVQPLQSVSYETFHLDLRAMELQGYVEVRRLDWRQVPHVQLSEAGHVALQLLEELFG